MTRTRQETCWRAISSSHSCSTGVSSSAGAPACRHTSWSAWRDGQRLAEDEKMDDLALTNVTKPGSYAEQRIAEPSARTCCSPIYFDFPRLKSPAHLAQPARPKLTTCRLGTEPQVREIAIEHRVGQPVSDSRGMEPVLVGEQYRDDCGIPHDLGLSLAEKLVGLYLVG
jgi:hypothetical protein